MMVGNASFGKSVLNGALAILYTPTYVMSLIRTIVGFVRASVISSGCSRKAALVVLIIMSLPALLMIFVNTACYIVVVTVSALAGRIESAEIVVIK